MYLQFDLFKSAEVPERSKGVDLSSTATASWVRIPPSAYIDLFTFTLAEVPERSKGVDLSSTATASWVRIPPSAFKTSYSKPQKFFF